MKLQIPFLDLSRFEPELKEALQLKFEELLEKGIFSGGEEVSLFIQNLKNQLSATHVVPCANGTDALEIALRALGIGEGDEVLVPALTWVSTAEVVKICGARPVFADVDENGLMDLNLLDSLLSPNTKAIIPVHLYGQMVDMPRLMDWAISNKVKVIEDAAQAYGAYWSGKSAGTWGHIGCFSFYPTKNLGALGEAGALTSDDNELAKKINLWINHGQEKRDWHVQVGRNSRIDTLQAAFLNVKLGFFEQWQRIRKEYAKMYLEGLSDISEIKLPSRILENHHNAHLFVIQVNERNELRKHLEDRGIGTAIHYPTPLPKMKPFWEEKPYPMAESLCERVLSIPLNPWMEKHEVEKIIFEIRDFYSSTS